MQNIRMLPLHTVAFFTTQTEDESDCISLYARPTALLLVVRAGMYGSAVYFLAAAARCLRARK